MKIENAKNLLIAIKYQIAKNLTNDLKFTEEFDLLIDNCDASKTYAKFCIKLLERVRLGVNPKYKEALLILTAVINLFKNNGTREEFLKAVKAADACTAASAGDTDYAPAYYATWAAYEAYAASAYSAAASASASAFDYAADSASAASRYAAKAAIHDSSDYRTEYKQQSIDLLQVLRTKAGRPKGSKNFIKKEKNVKILIPKSLLSTVKNIIGKLLKNETS